MAPSAGAVVMATGIVAIALYDAHDREIAYAFGALACAGWLALAVVLAVQSVTGPGGWWRSERDPGALTQVAATTVVGAQFAALGWRPLAWTMLGVAAVLWLVLVPAVLTSRSGRADGAEFLGCVATQGLVVTAAPLVRRGWLWALVGALAVGLGLYVITAVRFRWRDVLDGRGDHWVAGGALAISSLATARIVAVSARGRVHDDLRTLSVVLWWLAAGILAVLAVGELVRPRPRYDIRRWSTVFPVGMFAAATGSVGLAADHPGLVDGARGLAWIAVALWLVVATGAVRSALRAAPEQAVRP